MENEKLEIKTEDFSKYKLILEHCYNDFERQEQRKVNVDTKTSYVLVIWVFLLEIILQLDIIGIMKANFLEEYLVTQIVIKTVVYMCYLGNISLALISMFFLIRVLINRRYDKLSSSLWNIDEINSATELEILKGLINNYTRIINSNTKKNDKVMKCYKIGIVLLIISVFFTIVLYLLEIFI